MSKILIFGIMVALLIIGFSYGICFAGEESGVGAAIVVAQKPMEFLTSTDEGIILNVNARTMAMPRTGYVIDYYGQQTSTDSTRFVVFDESQGQLQVRENNGTRQLTYCLI